METSINAMTPFKFIKIVKCQAIFVLESKNNDYHVSWDEKGDILIDFMEPGSTITANVF